MSICIIQPLIIAPNGDLNTGENIKLIQSRIEQVVMTRGTGEGHVGEVPWDPDQGTLLYLLRHQNLHESTIKDFAKNYTQEALSHHLPEIFIKDIVPIIQAISSGNALSLNIVWSYNELEGDFTIEVGNV